jgi:hypothetical protein
MSHERGERTAIAPVATALLALLASMLAIVSGCDREQKSPPAAQAAPPPTAAELHEKYVQSIQPLLEEMKRLRILLEQPATLEDADFVRQSGEIKLRWEQNSAKLSAIDKSRSSWKEYEKAIDALTRCDRALEQRAAILARRPGPPPRPATLADLDIKRDQLELVQNLEDTKNLLNLGTQVPRLKGVVLGQIYLAESRLQNKE